MEVKPGYKQTEVGVIPEEWDVRRIGDLGNVVRGGSPRPAGDPRYFDGNFIPWLTVAALTNIPDHQLEVSETATCLTEEGSKHSRTLAAETLIIANSGATLGVAKLLKMTCCANDGIAAIINQRLGEKRFVSFYINTQTKKLREVVATGNGQPNLNTGLIREVSIPFPPPAEQRAIAEALSDVDGLLGGLDRLIAKKRDLKQAAMQQLLTGQTRLPGFHGEWEVKRLDELGTWKGGMTPSMQNPDYWLGGTVPWISSGDVKSVLLKKTGFAITQLAVKRGTTTLLPASSIVLVTRSGILRKYLPVAMNVIPMAINQDIKALIPSGSFSASFLLHTITCNGDRILAQCMKAGTTVESVEFRWLKAFTIPVPQLPEQIAIAEVLTEMDAELAALEHRREKTRALKLGMMQELLTGSIRLV